MNVQREARNDAREYARAQMYYGEGAGNRRKLIFTAVEDKARRDPAYARVFHTELARQDMAEHAQMARKERERADRHEAMRRNAKAFTTGNYGNASSSVLMLGIAAYVAHQTGLDKKAWKKGKEVYYDLKTRIQKRRAVNRVLKDTTPNH
jgi:hypothetical protein